MCQEDRRPRGTCAELSPRGAKTCFSQPAAGRLNPCLFSCTPPIRHFYRHRHILAVPPPLSPVISTDFSTIGVIISVVPTPLGLLRQANRCLRSSPGPCRRRIPSPPTTPGGLCQSRIQWSNVLKYYFKLVIKCIHILRLVRREEAVEKCLFVHEQLSFLSSSKTSVKDGVGVCDRPGQRAETSISARTSEPTIYSLHRTHQHWQQH